MTESDLAIMLDGINIRDYVTIGVPVLMVLIFWLLARDDAFYRDHLERYKAFEASYEADFIGPPLPFRRPKPQVLKNAVEGGEIGSGEE